MKAKTVKEVLIATKYILEQLDWCQKVGYRDALGFLTFNDKISKPIVACCLYGALILVECDVSLKHAAGKALSNQVKKISNYSTVEYYNDYVASKKEHVIKLVEDTIKDIQ